MTEHTDNWCPEDPVPGVKQDRRQLVGPLCQGIDHTGWRPLLLTGLLRNLLTNHFGDARRIEEPDLRNLIWTEGPSSAIQIESADRFRPDMAEARPALFIKRNSYRRTRKVIGDLVDAEELDGSERFIAYWAGAHTVFCLSGSSAAAELLGAEVARELDHFGPHLVQALNLDRAQVLELGGLSNLAESTDTYVVPVTMGFLYQSTWSARPEARPLMSMDMTLEPE